MTLNQLKREVDKFINDGFGHNRIMLNIDDGIQSALNKIYFYTKEVKGVDETFILLSDGGDYEEIEDYE